MDCASCPEIRRELGKGPPDCAACDYPGLAPGNLAAWEVIQTAGPSLIDGWGGVNLANARQAAEALGYAWDRELLLKIMAWADIMLEKDNGD